MAKQADQKPSWRRRAEARPEEILDAALEIFLERGFEAARMEDIARAAGLSKGSLYLYFESKEALLKALIEREIASVISAQIKTATDASGSVQDALTGLMKGLVGNLSNPRFFAVPRIMLAVASRFPELRDHYRLSVVEPARLGLEAIIQRGIDQGEIRAVDPTAAARTLIGPVFFEAMRTHVLGGESAFEDSEHFVRSQTDILLHGLKPKEKS